MMWGRWQTVTGEPPREKDRRERARIVVNDGAAILLSAPIFNVGKGNPYEQIENLGSLGPDVLPYKRKFNKREFLRRLLLPEHVGVTIGAALLNQRILAGLGNYLRAEVLFSCRINPWRQVSDLTEQELECLSQTATELSRRAYEFSATAPEEDRERMSAEPALVYQPGREYGTRHLVFRRTNLPCLRCGETIKQLRQRTQNFSENENDEERTRIVYFCPRCQGVNQ
jgi:formamidopyrimidine-DNA glycosylase